MVKHSRRGKLDDAVAASGVENLWLLPCGRQRPIQRDSPRPIRALVLPPRQYDLVIINSQQFCFQPAVAAGGRVCDCADHHHGRR